MRAPIYVQLCVGLALAHTTACKLDPTSLEGFLCEDNTCGKGFTCDTATNVCVTTGSSCAQESQELSCEKTGARTCVEGKWTDCTEQQDTTCTTGTDTLSCSEGNVVKCLSTGILEVQEVCSNGCNTATSQCNCVPGCTDDDELVACDDKGVEVSKEVCGNGCNATTLECNCVPGCTTDDEFVVCDNKGAEVSRESCVSDTGCGGSCTVSGCNGNNRAEGAACIGTDRCTHACDGNGTCVSKTIVCDDDNECTQDTCNAERGCEFSEIAVGTPCSGSDADKCNSTCDSTGQCTDATPVSCTAPLANDTPTCAASACNATTGECTETVPLPIGTECRAAANECDVAELCVGGVDCPLDAFNTGAPCNAQSNSCNSVDNNWLSSSCNETGACVANTPQQCLGACFTDSSCNPATGCAGSIAKDCDTQCGCATVACEGNGACTGFSNNTCVFDVAVTQGVQSVPTTASITVSIGNGDANSGCANQAISCVAKGRFIIMQDPESPATYAANTATSGWEDPTKFALCSDEEGDNGLVKNCQGTFVKLEQGTSITHVANVTGYDLSTLRYRFRAALSEGTDKSEGLRLQYCCGDICDVSGSTTQWSVNDTFEWTQKGSTVAQIDGSTFNTCTNTQADSPYTLLRTRFRMESNKNNEFGGIDNLMLTAQRNDYQVDMNPGTTAGEYVGTIENIAFFSNLTLSCTWAETGAVINFP